jgi:hypothetical protein
MHRFLSSLLGLALLTGCSDGVVDFPPLSFTRYHPIYLNVSNIEYVEEYKSPMKAPFIEHLMPYSPSEAMHVWVKDRIRTIGNDKFLQVIIKDGSVKASQLPTPQGVKGLLTISQDRQYDAKLDVELRIYGGGAMSDANVHVAAHRSITLAENASVHTRDAAFRRMIAEMMESVNAELEKNIYQYMGKYINYSQNP